MIISNQQDNEMEHLNKRIQTVAVLGAGAVGCYLIAGLAPKLGAKPLDYRRRQQKRAAGKRKV